MLRLALAMAVALALVAGPIALAQAPAIPGAEDGATDGRPLDRDGPAVLAALEEMRASLSGQRIHDCVANATSEGATQYRLMGTPTEQMFVEKHKDEFSQLGLASALQRFDEGSAGVAGPATLPTKGGTNIIGVLPGKDLHKWIVLGGHYDTQLLTFGGGALDNASGFCTVEEIAKALVAYTKAHGPLEATVVLAWYDGEEWGLYGSVALAKDTSVPKKLLGLALDADIDILVAQSYDMPGLNYPAKNTWVQYGDPATTDEYAVLNLRTAPTHVEKDWACFSYGCYQKLKERDDIGHVVDRNSRYQALVREVAYDELQLPREYVWVWDDSYGRSDHVPFLALGAAGGRIQGSHDQEFPHYHQPTDTLPALYQLAGGKELLIAGYTTEAQAGFLPAFYAALTGDVGHYGKPGDALSAAAAGDGASGDQRPVPFGAALPILALIAAFLLRRR